MTEFQTERGVKRQIGWCRTAADLVPAKARLVVLEPPTVHEILL